MQFSPTDQASLIAAIGETVTINTVVDDLLVATPITGDFRLESQPLQMFDGSVMSSAPTLRITEAVKTAQAIDLGSSVTCRSVVYTVIEMRQEQSGLWLLILTKA